MVQQQYVPNLSTYLDNGVISAGSCMALVHSTFLLGDGISKETISMLKPYPRLFSCSGEILRLWDDLGTSRVLISLNVQFRLDICTFFLFIFCYRWGYFVSNLHAN